MDGGERDSAFPTARLPGVQRDVHVAELWCCSCPGQGPAQVALEVSTCSSRLQGVLAHVTDSSSFASIMATEANVLS